MSTVRSQASSKWTPARISASVNSPLKFGKLVQALLDVATIGAWVLLANVLVGGIGTAAAILVSQALTH